MMRKPVAGLRVPARVPAIITGLLIERLLTPREESLL
jgi:hypothetical protein